MKYGLYYDYKNIGDVLIILFDATAQSDWEEEYDDVVCLYSGDRLIGIYIYNISKIFKIKAKGYIPLINKKIHEVINTILLNAKLEPLEFLKHSGYVVARINEIEEHPTNKELKVCKLNVGDETLQVVSGAENIRENLLCVCALPYTFLPKRRQVIPTTIEGVDSFGLICSAKDLQIKGAAEENKVLELDETYSVGIDFWYY
ncbi:MAG: hypothetical protein J6X03_04775 [Bacilli bacterium]|nr:hypothetical protein [Bacilli bacterium]